MEEQESPGEPPVLVIVLGCLVVIGVVVWLVRWFFNATAVKGWMVAQLGGWALPVGILLPGIVVGWILKKVFE